MLYCIGCGSSTDHTKSRMMPTNKFKEFVRRWCSPSRFHYRVIMEMPCEGDARICKGCVSWRRRCARGGSRHGRYTPMDSVLLYVLEPGAVPTPDRRLVGTLTVFLNTKVFTNLFDTEASSASFPSCKMNTTYSQD